MNGVQVPDGSSRWIRGSSVLTGQFGVLGRLAAVLTGASPADASSLVDPAFEPESSRPSCFAGRMWSSGLEFEHPISSPARIAGHHFSTVAAKRLASGAVDLGSGRRRSVLVGANQGAGDLAALLVCHGKSRVARERATSAGFGFTRA